MHFVAHAVAGLALAHFTGSPMALVGSLVPDLALLPNELRRGKFNKWDVKYRPAYRFTHSLFFVPLGLFFGWPCAIAILLHVIMDLPFHTSALRWAPFMVNRYKSKRKALLLSGGMDSVACAMIEKDFTCVFFDYGQSYMELELVHARALAEKLGQPLVIIKKDWRTDIPNRNFYMVSELAQLGYDEVIIGTRNISPFFDRHGDSNWLVMKVYQMLLGIYINMPVVGLFKWQIRRKTNGNTFYSTEA